MPKWVTKFVDQQTKLKELFLIKDKRHTTDSLELYNKAVLTPNGERLVYLEGDRYGAYVDPAYPLVMPFVHGSLWEGCVCVCVCACVFDKGLVFLASI